MGHFRRFIVEYIGNVQFWYPVDRRTDWRARELMDWFEGQMEARRLEERGELVHDFRQVMRPDDRVSEWVPDVKGESRDGPT